MEQELNAPRKISSRTFWVAVLGITPLAVILGILLLVLTAYTAVGIQNKIKEGQYIGRDIEAGTVITVSGTGEVYAKPDLALSTFSVITEAKTVAEAMSENTKKMNAIIEAMKAQKIEDKDLKTVNFSIYPRYEWIKPIEGEISLYPEGQRILVGYEISQSLQVKIRDLEKVGQIIEDATKAGANQVGDLQFTIDQEDEFKKQAREDAIKDAKEKADGLASQLGVKLVRIANFYESSSSPYYGYEKGYGIGGGDALSAAPAPSIATGENKITTTVSITYIIN